MVGHFRAAVLDGVVAGVGWLYRQGARAEIDVRDPRFRKQGVGTGLFEALTWGTMGMSMRVATRGRPMPGNFLRPVTSRLFARAGMAPKPMHLQPSHQ